MRWSSETHDNEHDGKKSSKSCCIFHKPRAWDESSSESGGEDGEGAAGPGRPAADPGEGREGGGDDSSSSGGPVQRRPERRVRFAEVEDEADGFFE